MSPPDPQDSGIPHLNRAHLHVLQILWNADRPLKPAEIEERFEWPIENATLRSVLRVLVERGELQRGKSGKAFVYQPKRQKIHALSDLLAGLSKVFSSGSRVGLLAQLLQEDSLTPEEVRELSEIAQHYGASDKPKNEKKHPNKS